MKTTVLLAAAVVVGLTVSAEARVRYQGVFHVVSQAGCSGNPVGRITRVGYLPAGVTDNGPNTTVSLFDQRGTLHLEVTGPIGTTAKTARTTEIFNYVGKYDNPPKIRFLAARSFSAAPKFVTVTGELAGYEDEPGCTIRFRMGLMKRF